jgi:hypothetical protein
MEDHFDKLLYLIGGIIYLFLNNAKSRHAERQTIENKDSESQPAQVAHTNWPDTRNREVQETLVKKLPQQPTIAKRKLPSENDTTIHPPTQKPHGKRIDRRLRQYSSWKKAIIMGELLQPRS